MKATSIFVTHDQVEAMTMADRLVVMNQGVVEQSGTPREIYRRPVSTYVAGFIGAPPMNLLPATVSDDDIAIEGNGVGRIALPENLVTGRPRRQVVLGVRPEHLTVAADGGEILLSARLSYAEDLGAARLLHCTVADVELVVHTQDDSGRRPGDILRLAAESTNLHLFDAETGRRIEATGRD